jgi:hypothetical protein
MKLYIVKRSKVPFDRPGPVDSPEWRAADMLSISAFLPESSNHRPTTRVKLLYDRYAIHILFKVSDRFVRCVHPGYTVEVWNDSCVEWFVQPKPLCGYFNFEVSCGGGLYASYVEDPTRVNGKLKKSSPLPLEVLKAVSICHSMPEIVEPEIVGPVEWSLELCVPISVFEPFVGPVGDLAGQVWRANFYKCGDKTSHPHWAAWSPVREKNFHCPGEFGTVRFA